jgi:hypothetical protein
MRPEPGGLRLYPERPYKPHTEAYALFGYPTLPRVANELVRSYLRLDRGLDNYGSLTPSDHTTFFYTQYNKTLRSFFSLVLLF